MFPKGGLRGNVKQPEIKNYLLQYLPEQFYFSCKRKEEFKEKRW